MSILAIDTCFSACSAAVHNAATGRISDRFERMETGHAERLVPMIAEVMAEAGLAFSELAAVAVTVGPGSFTGVRIGVSAGRALALAHGLETRAISSLEVMGQVARSELPSDASTSRELIVAMDARRGRLLVQRITAAGPADAPRLATVDEIAFAIVEAERESTAAYRRADALKRLYKLAREAGCIGADRAATAVMKKEGQ